MKSPRPVIEKKQFKKKVVGWPTFVSLIVSLIVVIVVIVGLGGLGGLKIKPATALTIVNCYL